MLALPTCYALEIQLKVPKVTEIIILDEEPVTCNNLENELKKYGKDLGNLLKKLGKTPKMKLIIL